MTKKWHSQVGIVALTAAMLAGCPSSTDSTTSHGQSGSPATSTSTAAHGVEATIDTVPWSQVGPGWVLAMWSPLVSHMPGAQPAPGEPDVDPDKTNTTLYLVDPAGGRYRITTFPPPTGFGGPQLVDWSDDGTHALFSLDGKAGQPSTAISVDLHTGEQAKFPVVNGYVAGYASPDAKSVMLAQSANADWPAWLERVDLSGNRELTYPVGNDYTGGFLFTPDGSQIVLGSSKGLSLMGNDGAAGKALPVPGELTHCSPVRWWNATVVLARCAPERFSSASQLWRVPVDGGAPTSLTAVNSGQEDDPGFGGDIGDVTAYELPSGTFLESEGACGSIFLSRLTPDGHTTRVDVPGIADSVWLKGVTGDKLVLVGKVGCGGGTSLVTYDPATDTTDVLLGPPINGGGVSEARFYP